VPSGIAAADSVRASGAPAAVEDPIPASAATPPLAPALSDMLRMFGMFDALRASMGSIPSRLSSVEAYPYPVPVPVLYP
jgi:hypothetical protein